VESENTDRAFDFYEFIYRDHIYSNCFLDVKTSEETEAYIKKLSNELLLFKSRAAGDEINFSDVIFDAVPVINGEENRLTYEYVPRLTNGNTGADVNEHIKRFKNLDIKKLPLIDVAEYLNIEVEKSRGIFTSFMDVYINPVGVFKSRERKIILGSDYEPTFIHELVHAIDSLLLSNYEYNEFLSELTAEFSTIVLCKAYNIKIDISASLRYLDNYSFGFDYISSMTLFERVSLIYECVKAIKNDIKNGVKNIKQRGRDQAIKTPSIP
jgi:hypothetical protein